MFWKTFWRCGADGEADGADGEADGGGMEQGVLQRFLPGMPV